MAESAQSMSSATAARERFFGHTPQTGSKGSEPSAGRTTESGNEGSSFHQEQWNNVRTRPVSDTVDLEGARRVWQRRWDEAPEIWRQFVSSKPKIFGMTESEEARIRGRNENYVETPSLTDTGRIGTTMIIGAVGAFSKLLMTTFNNLHLYDIATLHRAIENQQHSHGLLTFSNHQSVADDPFLLAAMLPARILLSADLMRWGLCSLDICFQDALVSRTLRLGKALPIERRGGIAQRFLRDAADKLAAGNWVHVYPEGRVRQMGMGYSKRGMGKLLAMAYEARQGLPTILPIYHEGVERVMPQDQNTNQLKSIIPHTGKSLFAIAGEPVDVTHIFHRLMPACAEAGGTQNDPPPCVRLYEEVADFMSITMRLMRAELRKRVKSDHGVDLGDPYEFS